MGCLRWESTKLRGQPNSGKGIGNYKCTTDEDCRTRSGSKTRPIGMMCGLFSPEDCSSCVMEADENGTLVGHCECAPPTRCSLCTFQEFYRLDDKCEKCPDQPWLIFALFAFAIIGALCGSYILNSYNFNMAFISIGVDYFQVLALFSRAKIRWPTVLKALLNFFSIFNFNIDVTAPECIIPEFEYEYKWYVIMLLPIGSMIFVIIAWLCILLQNIFYRHKRRWKEIASHTPMLVATMITLMYYMYLMLVRRIFDVYNCRENDVSPDGRLYASFTSIRCDGGVCACWEWDDPNSIQLRLFYLTIPGIFLYMVGFPAYLLFVLKRNKKQIKEDQILRAHGLGDAESENPYSFVTRQKYHRIYYHFKPGKTYWMVYIVFRKFTIALVGVLFRENPGFQLSITMLLLFVCYLAQQKHRPYMSSMERKKVVAAHNAKVKMGNALYRTIAEHIQSAKANKAKRLKRESVRRRRAEHKRQAKLLTGGTANSNSYRIKSAGVSLDIKLQEARRYKRSSNHGYFFDYNTVESFLLACAILVCLAGTMIESGDFTYPDGKDKTDIVRLWHTLI